MNIATTLRYVNLQRNSPWDERYYIMNDYSLMANKYGICLCAIMTPHGCEEIAERCDGLIVPGSATNIHPSYYGGVLTEDPPVVDEYALDSKLMECFLKAGKPIFGVCGGHQAINVHLGGTLKRLNDVLTHQNGDTKVHQINIKEGSFVHDVFQKTRATVNCYHGWEIDKLAPCLTSVAETDDGVIEAIECKEKHVFATQWHPEQSFHTGDPIENKFFENFIELCHECRR